MRCKSKVIGYAPPYNHLITTKQCSEALHHLKRCYIHHLGFRWRWLRVRLAWVSVSKIASMGASRTSISKVTMELRQIRAYPSKSFSSNKRTFSICPTFRTRNSLTITIRPIRCKQEILPIQKWRRSCRPKTVRSDTRPLAIMSFSNTRVKYGS